VTVDFQNNITLNGSSNFIIQVDGRQREREFLAGFFRQISRALRSLAILQEDTKAILTES